MYNLLNGYFGLNGSISNLLSQGLSANLAGIIGGGARIISPTWAAAGLYGAAEGGTFIATRPMKMLVGEKGAEQVSVTPLTRTGADVNKFSLTPRWVVRR